MDLSDTKLFYWLAASLLPAVGPITFRRWLNDFGEIEQLFLASRNELADRGLRQLQIDAVKQPDLALIKRILLWCEKNDCKILVLEDAAYPSLLKEIVDAPLVLYVQGEVAALSLPQIAMVGSRNPSPRGKATAEQFAGALAQAGLIITSGLAAGIDAASHMGAISGKAKTVAVMGAGLATIYPAYHRSLAAKIQASGALVSEFPPHVPPIATNFPRRNRIISGLSRGVLVVEAALQSGSLITAKLAAEQGREIFAIPGAIHHPLAKGCHYLIRQGAKLVETVDDILEELAPTMLLTNTESACSTSPGAPLPWVTGISFTPEEQLIFSFIMEDVTALDTIIIQSGLTVGEVSSMLLSLELKGYVQAVAGGYVRTPIY